MIQMLAGLLSLTIVSCGSAGRDEQDAVLEQAGDQKDQPEDEAQAGSENASEDKKRTNFSFAEFKNLEFIFSSGAGAWCTTMQIHEDGSFEGQYHDTDMGSHGEGYPNGTVYQSNFIGQFTTPVKVNDYTYSMQIARMDYEQEIDSEVIRDGVRYCYTDAYGLEEALTDEQRAWIAEKEQSVADAGAECEGGSMQPVVMNLRAAEMTKERVYELMEYLE